MNKAEENEDHALIELCQRGDKASFGKLVEKYMQRAYFTALGLIGDHEIALDLSQDAFVRAYRSIHKFVPEQNFFTWYYQILRNLCFNYWRDHARHARSFSEIGALDIETIVDTDQNSEKLAEQNEMKQALWQAMNELKPHEREIIVLKDFQELTYQQIAEALNCPIGTVMSRLFTARKALKQKLERFFND
ncbi:MAG: sigma-70 family RNA polymerase sigma factor [candidate division KSB1 bacterium]|nr:sigma-70 family RNA polymerase sigma factor [candidate division KSB1 bacterium]MDZ7402090.1 sigma-70 family RNA polymerase sigma factor [candidate division KSB1 bacterium]